MRNAAFGLLLSGLLVPSACATYENDLARGQSAFEASEHDRALAIFRGLEPDLNRFTDTQRAHYAYLRGMTDYRIGYKAEARHWLSLAAAAEQKNPGSVPEDWTKRLTDALKELNESVYTGGIESLTNTAGAKTNTGDDDTSEPDSPGGDTAPRKPNVKPSGSDG
jgi:hypothetical protein